MPRYAFIVKALSPRDGGWVRLGSYGAGGEGGAQPRAAHQVLGEGRGARAALQVPRADQNPAARHARAAAAEPE